MMGSKRALWLCAALAVLLATTGAAADPLRIHKGQQFFSELDGSPADLDGRADGTLTVDGLIVTGNGALVIDAATAAIEVRGDVELAGSGAIQSPAPLPVDGPTLNITAEGTVTLEGNSQIRLDGEESGGTLDLCSTGDIRFNGGATVSANSAALTGSGGTVRLLSEGTVHLVDPAGSVTANGADGGMVQIVSCALDGDAIQIQTTVEAVGVSGFGGTVLVEARQGGVAFHPVLGNASAQGAGGDGSITVTAATAVTPAQPSATPPASVTTDSPSAVSCTCQDVEIVVLVETDRPTGVVGTPFNLTARVFNADSPVADFQWDLGDGRTASGSTVNVSYNAPGLFAPTVTVTAGDGRTAEGGIGLVIFDPLRQAPEEMGLPELIGDVNGDGAITLADAHRIAKAATRLAPLSDPAELAADVDVDGDVELDDAALLARAVIDGETLPTVLSPASGAPGTLVNLISPELLDPEALVEIEVGNALWVQQPLRAARGYANFLIPLDPTTGGSIAVTPGPVEVRVLKDGVLAETLTFDLEAPAPLPADPRAELESFLTAYETLLERSEAELVAALEFFGVTPETEDLLLSINEVQRITAGNGIDRMRALLQGSQGEELAELVLTIANANGLQEYRERLDEFLVGGVAALQEKVGPGEVCDTILPVLCTTKQLSELIDTGGDVVGFLCDALLVAALIAVVVPADGPVVDAALLATWISACGAVEAALELGSLVRGFIGDLDADLGLEVDPASPGPDEPAIITGEVELIGLDDICTFGAGQGADKIKEKLTKLTVERLLKKKLALRAIKEAAELISEKALEKLTELLEEVVGKIIDQTGIADAFKEFADEVCAAYGLGAPLPVDLSRILEGPDPNVGMLVFNADGTAEYTCDEDPGPNPPESINFTATKDICGEDKTEMVSVACETRPVTITIGDNGFLNDDIFEVRIDGETVLTSSVPVRSISTTEQLPLGDTTVQMIGRAAPDGIGTYFISFSGATVVGGDATSGTDLTPGTVKTFIIRVQ